jgi:hypothetical protein
VPAFWPEPTATHDVAEAQETEVSKLSVELRLGLVRTVQVVPSQLIVKVSRVEPLDDAPTATHEVVEIHETDSRKAPLPTLGLGTTVAVST